MKSDGRAERFPDEFDREFTSMAGAAGTPVVGEPNRRFGGRGRLLLLLVALENASGEGEMRLVSGHDATGTSNIIRGRVEMFHAGLWGTFCA